jgi:hypothetical protein
VIDYIVEINASNTHGRSTDCAVVARRLVSQIEWEPWGTASSRGQHICAVYETPEEQIAIAAEYLADGLRAGERAFYVAENDTP